MSVTRSSLAIVILAAGKGTRMNQPDKAKVMFHLAGKPLIEHVVSQGFALEPKRIVVLVGYRKDDVINHLKNRFDDTLEFAEQAEQLGTGHAVQQTESLLQDFDGHVLILSGDVPLLTAQSLANFVALHRESNAAASVLTVQAPDPKGYGRIVRDREGNFKRIVEHKDATASELTIDEINTGVYLVRSGDLFSALRRTNNNNAQGEYYLTDIVEILRGDSLPVKAWLSAAYREAQGINTPEQLAEAEQFILT